MPGISLKKCKITQVLKTFSICAQISTISKPIRHFSGNFALPQFGFQANFQLLTRWRK